MATVVVALPDGVSCVTVAVSLATAKVMANHFPVS